MKIIQLQPLQKPIQAKVDIPGSKSYTNRALFIASITEGGVKIMNPLISDDTKAMFGCLEKLGIKIVMKENRIEVLGDIKSITDLSYKLPPRCPSGRLSCNYKLDVNESGTTMRFMLALSVVSPGVKTLYGKPGLNKRPIGELVEGLKKLGAKIEYQGKKGYPPVQVLSSILNEGTVKLSGSESSQYISALLMIAPVVGKLTIEVAKKQISKPYIDMTIDIMKKFGVKVVNEKYKKYTVAAGQKYQSRKFVIEGDLSSAGYFAAIAVLTKSKITLKNINPDSKHADIKFLKILESMGNKIIPIKNRITVQGKGVEPITVDMTDCPDQVQTLAVLAAFAKGVTKITGISSLRIKETDRLLALKQELLKMGIETNCTKNTLTIHGGTPKAARINTYGDHRMAMAFAVAGSVLEGLEICDPQVVTKTFPDFWEKLNSVGMKTKIVSRNIVLIGMRGSGKTTVAKILAKRLNFSCTETDELIVEKAGLSIPEIVKKYGWERFRELEHEAVNDVLNLNDVIVSTGGGIVINRQNIDLLKGSGKLFWLRCKVSTLVKRMGNDNNRPKLTDKNTPQEEVKEVLKQREVLYENAADHIINTDNLSAEEVVDEIIFRLGMANKRKLCMVIGDPVAQSISPKLHTAGYKALGIDDSFSYIAVRVNKEDLKTVLEEVKNKQIRGVSVTVPHKQAVIKYMDSLDPVIKYIGAVNTIICSGGKLKGYNTDWVGAITALEGKTGLEGKQVALFGAGGAARAIAYGLLKKGAQVKIYNRTRKEAEKLAKDLDCLIGDINNLEEVKKMDIIINATTLGMEPNINKTPLPKKFILNHHLVFDIVFKPSETRLIKEAKMQGARVLYGYEMLLHQAAAQFNLYTEMNAPIDIMREAAKEALGINES